MFLAELLEQDKTSVDGLVQLGGSTTLLSRKREANSSAFGTTNLVPENKSLSSASKQVNMMTRNKQAEVRSTPLSYRACRLTRGDASLNVFAA
jgi:hypothetical protein